MAKLLITAFAAALLVSCASAPPPASSSRSTGGWAFAYDAATGVASATQTESDGSVSVRVTCRTPDGDMMIADSRLRTRGEGQARFAVGQEVITVPSQGDGSSTTVRLPRRPPNLGAYAHLSTEPVSLSAGGATHSYASGAVEKLALVANSCWPVGS